MERKEQTMTQKEQLVDIIDQMLDEGQEQEAVVLDSGYATDLTFIACYLLNNGVRRVVRCYECEYLGIKGLTDGYCKKDIMGLVAPNDYCSRGKLKEGKHELIENRTRDDNLV